MVFIDRLDKKGEPHRFLKRRHSGYAYSGNIKTTRVELWLPVKSAEHCPVLTKTYKSPN